MWVMLGLCLLRVCRVGQSSQRASEAGPELGPVHVVEVGLKEYLGRVSLLSLTLRLSGLVKA